MRRNFGLDIIRALAILSVLLCHFSDAFYQFFKGRAEPLFNYTLWMFGYYGVEIFFILSGFLIGTIFINTIVHNEDQTLGFQPMGNFLIRRWIRTLPNYYLFLLINIAVAIVIGQYNAQTNLWPFFFFIQKLDYKTSLNFFAVSWSLAVEEWFYLLIAVSFFLMFLFTKNRKTSFILAILLILSIAYFSKVNYLISQPTVANHSEAFRYTTFFRLDSIAVGVIMAWYWSKDSFKNSCIFHKKKLMGIGLLILFVSLMYSFLLLANHTQYSIAYFLYAPICSIGIALCFPYMIDLKTSQTGVFYRSVMVLSLSSYSLYLCHLPIKMLFDYYTKELVWFHTLLGAFVKFSVLMSLSILIANFVYKYFEIPVLGFRDRISKVFATTPLGNQHGT